MSRDAAGVSLYGRCKRPPFLEDSRSYWPCREGGSAHGEAHLPALSHKQFMIIYTPAWYDELVSIINPDVVSLAHVFNKYEEAFESCIISSFRRPFDLRRFSICITARFDSAAGFTGIRGLAVIPAPPPNDLLYPKGGMHSPLGHVVGEHIKLRRRDTQEVLFDEIDESFQELWLVVGAPLRLSQC